MSAVRHWVSGIMLAAGSVAVVPQVVAQQEGATPTARRRWKPGWTSWTSRSGSSSASGSSRRTAPRRRPRTRSPPPPAPRTASASSRRTASSPLRLKGLVQTDGRFFLVDSAVPVTNTFFIRRARPILEATVGKYLEFRLQPDFGQGTTVLFDAYTDVKVSPAFAVRVGKFKPRGGSRAATSRPSDIVFAERALATNLAPNRDVGLQLSGDISQRCLHLAGRGSSTACPTSATVTATSATRRISPAASSSSRSRPERSRASASASRARTGLERGTTAAPAARRATARRASRPGSATRSSTTTPASNVFADGQPVAPRAAGLLLQRPARAPRRVHPVVAGGEPRRPRPP